MNVLVSDTTTVYDGWLVVRTLDKVLDIVGNIDNLVYHTSKESSDDKIKHLSNIYRDRTSCKIIYIRSRDKADNAVRMLVTGGLKGKYVDDEFFLESDRELNTLITDLNAIVDSTELSSSAVLMDFFNRYMSEGSIGVSKGYLQVVKNAALEMTESYHSKSIELLKMSESAAEIFSNSVDLISQMKKQQATLEKDLRVLRDKKQELDSFSFKSSLGSSIMYYPRVSYSKSKPIIRVKDLCRCNFIISFFLGFREYLEKLKNVRPKLIIIESNGAFLESRYDKYKWVTNMNKNDSRNYYSDIVFTNCPTSMILSRLLEDSKYDTFIVLDRTTNYKDHILNTRGSDMYAVSGESMIKKCKLNRSKCMSSISKVGGTMLTIPYFESYPERDDQRLNVYLRECATHYEILYNSKD